ncbi:MAG: Mov34/MPN/PAD-1 family protein [Solirubrobacterales bacterium]|nr:Mov34/MPN/PAD-1 family protein [Solirubrobacterales bacterium]
MGDAVFLDAGAHAVIEREALKRRVRETGGSLFGWEADDDVVVACATGPGPGAEHHPRSFRLAPAAVAAAMARVLEVSEGRYGYIGSWHTHPFGTARPSSVDSGTAKAMARQEDLVLPRPLLFIVSTTGTKRSVQVRELAAWLWMASQEKLAKVPVDVIELSERYCPAAELLYAGCRNETCAAGDRCSHFAGPVAT